MPDFATIANASRASQDTFELWKLLELIAQYEPRKILEIGVHRGYSAETWHNAFPQAEIIGVESDLEHIDFADFRIIHGDSRSSHTVEAVGKYAPFDFIFIDGDHTYEGARDDWEHYSPMLDFPGIVAIHDTARIGRQWAGKVETHRLFEEQRVKHLSAEFIGKGEAPGTGVLFP